LTSPCSPTTAAGTLHTKLEPLPGGDLIGAQLARQRPGLCSIDCVYGRGRFYILGPRLAATACAGSTWTRPGWSGNGAPSCC